MNPISPSRLWQRLVSDRRPRESRPRVRPARRSRRPVLEILEDRQLLTTCVNQGLVDEHGNGILMCFEPGDPLGHPVVGTVINQGGSIVNPVDQPHVTNPTVPIAFDDDTAEITSRETYLAERKADQALHSTDPKLIVLTHGWQPPEWVDEIGDMVRGIKTTINGVKEVISEVKDTVSQVKELAQTLDSILHADGDLFDKIGQLPDVVDAGSEVLDGISRIKNKADEAKRAIHELLARQNLSWYQDMANALATYTNGTLNPHIQPINVGDIERKLAEMKTNPNASPLDLLVPGASRNILALDWARISSAGTVENLFDPDFDEATHHESVVRAAKAYTALIDARVQELSQQHDGAKVDVLFISHSLGTAVIREVLDLIKEEYPELEARLDYVKVVQLDPVTIEPPEPVEDWAKHDKFYWYHPERSIADQVNNYYQTVGVIPAGFHKGDLIFGKPLDDAKGGGPAGYYNGQVRIWDVPSGEEVLRFHPINDNTEKLTGPKAELRDISYSPDGELLAFASENNTVQIVDADTGAHRITFRYPKDDVISLAFLPDGKYLAIVSKDNTVSISAIDDDVAGWQGTHEGVRRVAVSPDGTMLATSGEGETVKVWRRPLTDNPQSDEMPRFEEVFELSVSSDPVRAIAFAPNGLLVTGSDNGKVVVHKIEGQSSRALNTIGYGTAIREVALTPDGAFLAIAEGKSVHLFHQGSDETFTEVAIPSDFENDTDPSTPRERAGEVTTLAFDPAGRQLAVARDNHETEDGRPIRVLRMFDLHEWEWQTPIRRLSLPVRSISFSPDGRHIAFVGIDNYDFDANGKKVRGGPVYDNDVTSRAREIAGTIPGWATFPIHIAMTKLYIQDVLNKHEESFFDRRNNAYYAFEPVITTAHLRTRVDGSDAIPFDELVSPEEYFDLAEDELLADSSEEDTLPELHASYPQVRSDVDLLVAPNDGNVILIGDDTSSLSSQTVEQSARAGEKAIYFLAVQNDGSEPAQFIVMGTGGSSLWTVRYFDASINLSAGNDITDLVTTGNWSTRMLAPGAAQEFRVEVTPGADVPNDVVKPVLIRAFKTGDATQQDSVQALTRAIADIPTTAPVSPVINNSAQSGTANSGSGNTAAAPAVFPDGYIFVTDLDAIDGRGAVIGVDPTTGQQAIISQGGLFQDPNGLAIDATGQLIVADGSAGIIRVNPTTGTQTLVSSGGSLNYPGDIVIALNGDYFVTTRAGGQVIRVDPSNGTQTVVASGFVNPNGIVMDSNGDLIVAEIDGRKITRLDPRTGKTSVISTASGNYLSYPFDVEIASNGEIIALDQHATGGVANADGGVVGINPVNGSQRGISYGQPIKSPLGLAIEASGQVLVAVDGYFAPTAGIVRVDSASGSQKFLSPGGYFRRPADIEVVRIKELATDVASQAPVAQEDRDAVPEGNPVAPVQPEVQIVDNDDSGFSMIGTWQHFAGPVGGGYDRWYYQDDGRYNFAGSGSNAALYTVEVTPGTYRIYASEVGATNRATNSPFTIRFNETILDTVLLNQQQTPDDIRENGVYWDQVGGTYTITTPGRLTVELRDNANGVVVADAVRFERTGPAQLIADGVASETNQASQLATARDLPTECESASDTQTVRDGMNADAAANGVASVEEQSVQTVATPQVQIVDNDDSGFSLIGTWQHFAGSIWSGYDHWYFQDDGRYNFAGSGSNAALFSVEVTPGAYRIYASEVGATNRATNSPFTIRFNEAIFGTVLVNQQQTPDDIRENGVFWDQVGGTYTITAPGRLTVELRDNADGIVVADAIRFERVADVLTTVCDSGAASLPDQSSDTTVRAPADDIVAAAARIPVARWTMDETFADALGRNHPSATHAVSFVDGPDGAKVVAFGPGAYIEIPHSPELALQRFTIAVQVMPAGPGSNNDVYGSVVLSKALPRPTGDTNVPIGLWWSALDNRFRFASGNIVGNDLIVSANAFAPGQFYDAVVTYDGVAFRLFVNGHLEGELRSAKTIQYDSTVPWTIGATPQFFRDMGYARTLNGAIGEVVIFDKPFDEAEVQTVFQAAAGDAAPSNANTETAACAGTPTSLATVQIADDDEEIIITEGSIQQFVGGSTAVQNLAQGKSARQSSTNSGGEASRAVDGNTDGEFWNASVSHTNADPGAWWEVDLGATHDIQEIELWNRTDCCSQRLHNFYVLVSATPIGGDPVNQDGVWRYYHDAAVGQSVNVSVNQLARYVRVQMVGSEYLQLAEVKVIGTTAIHAPPNSVPADSPVTSVSPSVADQAKCEANSQASGPSDAAVQAARALMQQLGITESPTPYEAENRLGEGDKWLRAANGNYYYYLLPSGALFSWTTRQLVGTVDAYFYQHPEHLPTVDPIQSAHTLMQQLGITESPTPYEAENRLGQGDKWLRAANGNYYYYLLPSGALFSWTTRQHVGTVDPYFYQHPEYLLGGLSETVASASANPEAGGQITSPSLIWQCGITQYAPAQDNYLGMGLNEKWFRAQNGNVYFFLTADGVLRRWTNSYVASYAIGTVDPFFFDHPQLLLGGSL